MTRMATLAPGGRITTEVVQEEISRLKLMWSATETDIASKLLNEVIGADRADQLDRFEKVQLADVLKVCKESKNMSEAGRKVFAVSRTKKQKANDADRLRKYLSRYHIKWGDL